MSARRLNDTEKQEIIQLYRTTGATSSSLAEQFGVSNSTIGRVLKNGIEGEEYDALVQQKRGRSTDTAGKKASKPRRKSTKPKPKPKQPAIVAQELEEEIGDEDLLDEDAEDLLDEEFEEEEEFDDADEEIEEEADPEYLELAAELQSDEDEDEDEFDEDEDEFDEDEDEFEDDEDDSPALQLEARDQLTILPLADASVPRVFYLVVDRGADLVAPPLGEFGELGEMSSEEASNPTLPMFDNHRVAKRFSNSRTQRVIKVPDNQLFYKTTRHLSAKGIKRFLLDGQVYTLV